MILSTRIQLEDGKFSITRRVAGNTSRIIENFQSSRCIIYEYWTNNFIFKRSKIVFLCISTEMFEVFFFVTGLETLQILGCTI
jgi:hypothetical protein